MTCLQGASLAEMTLGKKLPTSASCGQHLELVEEAFGSLRIDQGADAVGDFVEGASVSRPRASFMRRSEPNWLMRTRAPG